MKTNVNDLFEQLAANPSKNFKIEFMTKHADNKDFKEAIRLALDPYIQFYLRKIPAYTPSSKSGMPLNQAMQHLTLNLAARKVTGNAAIEYLKSLLESVSADDAKVIERIIQKDPRCGIDTSPNKVWEGLIPEYPCMLCAQYEEKLVDKMHFPAFVQLKMDGMRFNAIVRNNKCEFRSRNGRLLNLMGALEQEFIEMAAGMEIVFDGELLVEGMDRKAGNGILNKANKGTLSVKEAELVQATIWDSIRYNDFTTGRSNENYDWRLARVIAARQRVDTNKIHIVKSESVDNYNDAKKVFEEYLAQGLEGIILKNPQSPWEDKRVKHQIKFKGELEADLKIVGTAEGKGKAAGMLGALKCESSEGIIKVDVGSGFSDEQRKAFWKTRTSLVGKVVAVKYNSRISRVDGTWSLFLPIFIEVREDKTKPDSNKEIK